MKKENICGYQKWKAAQGKESDEGCEKVHTSSYKINENQRCHVQHVKYINTAACYV